MAGGAGRRSAFPVWQVDIALKLRIANGLHTAMVYAMALSRLYTTERCADGGCGVLAYLEQA